jgi:hypothetical protein
VEIEGFGETGGPTPLPGPTESGGELRRVGEPCKSDPGRTKNLSKDWGGDGGVWGSGSGCAGGVGYTDHGGGGLPDRGEGKGVGNQFDLRRASGDGSFWCEGAG